MHSREQPRILPRQREDRGVASVAAAAWRLLGRCLAQSCRPVEQFAPAVRTPLVERIRALGAEGAFERADERAGRIGGKLAGAAFAGKAHFQHQAAAFRTASQIRSTTRSTWPRSSPSAITRITGSVPDGRMTRRPVPRNSASAVAITALTASSSSGFPPPNRTFLSSCGNGSNRCSTSPAGAPERLTSARIWSAATRPSPVVA